MARREVINETGISRINIEGNANDAWCAYICVNCKSLNLVRVGQTLLTPKDAYENASWICSECGYEHSKLSDLPNSWDNWGVDMLNNESLTVQRFWQAFFRSATENPEAYWKQCNVCGRILPNSYFSKHSGWGPLEKQMECRACKGAINAVLNPERTSEQLREGSIRRRLADMFLVGLNQKINVDALFKRFGGKCFKTGKSLDKNATGTWHIDHILPSKYLYPLTVENAALLSSEANSNKRDIWPSKFYTPQELVELAKITGADLQLLTSPEPIMNTNIDVNGGVDRYLNVRNSNDDMPKRISEIRKILETYDLVDKLDKKHRSILGYPTTK
jgi:hypothetical protein